MAELPLDEAIPRFKANENRIDQFTNGDDLTVWIPSGEGAAPLPSLAKFLKDKEAEFDLAGAGIQAQAVAAAATATTKAAEASASATAADASADAAQAILEEMQSSATNLKEKMFTGDGVTTAFTLDANPGVKQNVLVWIGGSIQDGSDYSVSGTTLTITPAVVNGVEIRTLIIGLVTANEIEELKNAAEQAATAAVLAAGSLTYANDTEADAGTASDRIMSPAKTVRWYENWSTKLWGANSLARTFRARWGDTVNLRDWFNTTGSEGTETINDTQIAALITHLTANPSVKYLVGNPGDVYRISAINQVMPAGITLDMRGAKFRWSGLLGGGSSQFLQFGAGSKIIGLHIVIVTGSTFRRLIGTSDNCVLIDWIIEAESQINNYGGSLLDWAVRIYRSNNYVRNVKAVNIDRPWFAYGDLGDGQPGVDNYFESVQAFNYSTGFCLRNLDETRNINPYMRDRSANATDNPGFNGLLHEGVSNYKLIGARVADAGEHGIRFGGTRNAEQASRMIHVSGCQILRSGQSGLKFFTGIADQRFLNVHVSDVHVVDCQYEPETPAEGPGFNDEGFLLQQIQKGTFTGLSVEKQLNATYSCMDGVYISGCDNLRIYGLAVQDPKRNAVRISEWDDGTGAASVETLANNEIMIWGLHGENVGEDGIFIDSPTQPLRDINIEGELIGNNVAGFYAFDTTSAIARFAQPSLVQIKQRNFAAGMTSLASSGNWKIRDVFGSTY